MAETQGNTALLHRKEWEPRMILPEVTAAAKFFVTDPTGSSNYGMYVGSATAQYLYHFDEDDFVPIVSGALTGFALGAAGVFMPWTPVYTATGGSTTTITVNAAVHNLLGSVRNHYVEWVTGANAGRRSKITAILVTGTATGTITLTIDAVANATANNDTFRISLGSFFIYGGSATAVFKRFDLGTQTWSSALSTTGITGTTAETVMCTAGKLNFDTAITYDSGTATTMTATLLTDATAKGWTSNQWIGYQLRITGGTGFGQVPRVITASGSNTLTVGTGTVGGADTTYVIEGDDNALYLTGNGGTAMMKYTIDTRPGQTANTWTAMTVRTSAAGAGVSADHIDVTGDSGWANITNIKDGRYIYSLRGGGSVLDRYDIAGNSWAQIAPALNITVGLGSSANAEGRYLYIMKEGSATVPNRFYKFAIRGNFVEPVTTDLYLGGAAVTGVKLCIKRMSATGAIKWLYYLQSATLVMRRIMLF